MRDVITEREKRREQFRRDAEAAWHAYQADGLHLTADEADSWLKTIEAGEGTPPPECHG
ncbi:MAG: hypothetical protein ACRC67_04845 [Inquilinus sp.]|uniref:hypothetical protein n=1 Tax=Inquilinus sp. TaxID=1932117 RepID=UPI003F2B0F87